MTIFCPNCGAKNTDEAASCVACGTELKGKSSKKFKGTMMMSGVQIPTPEEMQGRQAGAGADAPPGEGAARPPGAPPAGGERRNMAFQKTMAMNAGAVPPPPTGSAATPPGAPPQAAPPPGANPRPPPA
ncbi:MAG: zinc ribbon domain-containing protein, partial [Sandaracinaceae bacterium]